jgi:DNA-binding CsgD family transcriptional regulator
MAMSTIDFFQKHIHPEDAAIYENQVFTNYISSAKIISNDKIQNCRFSLNFRFKRKDGVYIKVLQQSTILETNDQGYPIVSAGILVDITDYKSDDKMILSVTSFDAKTGFKTISSISYSSATNILTAREKEIIKHIALGHSTSEIANLLSISQYTVNAHRRNIYDKTSCKNLAELINFAITNGLI